ncbi:coiled-coil domain-containing protein 43 [Chironomus tepperi]|uniref:coiled-coil domain-containing protein 43 n=1 Tax=Chironomus tepperi TaxID=113505 RepID=UPI00391EEAEE
MFDNWLKTRLKELKIDVSVYLSYIVGILEDSIDEEEKRETLTDIISSLIESDTEKFVNEIFEKWVEAHGAPKPKEVKKEEEVDIAKMLETQAKLSQQASNYKKHQLSEEERRIKEQILANYSQTEFKEEDDDDDEELESDDVDPDLEKNTNKSDVQKLAKEKRDQARLDSQQKKQKDKEDRAKQKANRDEKKANRKAAAVKGERRR